MGLKGHLHDTICRIYDCHLGVSEDEKGIKIYDCIKDVPYKLDFIYIITPS